MKDRWGELWLDERQVVWQSGVGDGDGDGVVRVGVVCIWNRIGLVPCVRLEKSDAGAAGEE